MHLKKINIKDLFYISYSIHFKLINIPGRMKNIIWKEFTI